MTAWVRDRKNVGLFAGMMCCLLAACGDSQGAQPRPDPSAGSGGVSGSGSNTAGKGGTAGSAGSTAGSGATGGNAGTSAGKGGAAGEGGKANGGAAGEGEAGAESAGEGGTGGDMELGGLGAECENDDQCAGDRICYGDFGCAVVCVEESTELTTDAEVSALAASACEVLDGSLSISGSELTDLASLESGSLHVITGDLSVNSTTSLESLRGLGGLERVGGSMVFQANARLTSLEGLEGLDRIGSNSVTNSIVLASNPLLESIAALGNASRILSGVVVTDNASLQSLAGIDHLRATSNVIIANNAGLTELGGLQTLEDVGTITIASNDSLATAQLLALETAESLSFTVLAQLSLLSLPALTSVTGSLVVAANPSLLTLGDTDGWLSVSAMTITDNASLPQCEVDLLDARLTACADSCALNDEEATCE